MSGGWEEQCREDKPDKSPIDIMGTEQICKCGHPESWHSDFNEKKKFRCNSRKKLEDGLHLGRLCGCKKFKEAIK